VNSPSDVFDDWFLHEPELWDKPGYRQERARLIGRLRETRSYIERVLNCLEPIKERLADLDDRAG